jgi:hypothetical protein
MWNFQKDIFKSYQIANPVMTEYSYTGIYERNDPNHPDGGSLDYVDINGVTRTLSGLYAVDCISFLSQSPPTNIIKASTCFTSN